MTELYHNKGETNLRDENLNDFKSDKLESEEENVLKNQINATASLKTKEMDVSPPITITTSDMPPKLILSDLPTTQPTTTTLNEDSSDVNTTSDVSGTTNQSTELVKPKLKFNTTTFTFRMIFIITLIVILSSIVSTRGKFEPIDTFEVLADQRRLISWIPNTMDVLSNLPFLIVGIIGVFVTLNVSKERIEKENERINYLIFFISVGMATFGSSYYFLKPHSKRLFWHRLPRAISFTSLFYIVITEKFDKRSGGYLLGSLITFGFISVVYWIYTEMNYRGDLYILLQFTMTLVSPFILHFYESRYTHSEYFYAYFILGLFSKAFESLDVHIFNFTGQRISGHTLHHIFSAVAALTVAFMLPARSINHTKVDRIEEKNEKKKID